MDAQYISDAISRGLNSKQFNDHEDEVKRRAGYCKGNERWVSGTTEVINVKGTLDGITYTGRVKLKFLLKRKIFYLLI